MINNKIVLQNYPEMFKAYECSFDIKETADAYYTHLVLL